MDPVKFSKLAFVYSKFPAAKLARNKVTPRNVKLILESFAVPIDIALVNLDIDSYDLHVIDEMLKAGYRPKLISMEVNEKIPAGVFFTVDYDDRHCWQVDHFYGCSIEAASSVVKPFGYILHSMNYNNAVFIRSDLAAGAFLDVSPKDAYDNGYKNQANRMELFPWNADVEQWLHSGADEVVAAIRSYFAKYEGKFTVRKV